MVRATGKDPFIVIVGAGPAGLLTAHYLKQNGYRHVTVLERRGEVGGLCKTINAQGHAFDLGANYLTPAYTEILKLARELGLPTYSERPFIAMTPPEDPNGRVRYQSIFRASRTRDDGSIISLPRFTWALMRYGWIRWRLGKVIDKPSFAGVADYRDGELCEPLQVWLDKHRLSDLTRVFQLPITLMGFGDLNETATLYALKFMTLRSFFPMVLKEAPLIGTLVPWPRRFVHGYQRFFERLAWQLDVRTGVDITRIHRDLDGVQIDYTQLQQDMDASARSPASLKADWVIFACPLNSELVLSRTNMNPNVQSFFKHIEPISYCMTTHATQLDSSHLGGASPLVAVYPVPRTGSNVPYGVAKQWPHSPMTQFYTRTASVSVEHSATVEQQVQAGVQTLLKQMGGELIDDAYADSTFNRFEYFQHLKPELIKAGWYDDLEALQGAQRSFYVGGATNFELIEPIAQYSRNLVQQNFPTRARPGPLARLKAWFNALSPGARHRWTGFAALMLVLAFVYVTFMPLKSVPIERPVSHASPAALAATERFWEVIHANDASQIESLIQQLSAAHEQKSRQPDATLSAILGGTHLWRFHLRHRLKSTRAEQLADLRAAVRFGQESIAADDSPDSTAPSLTAVAQWQLAVLEDQPADIAPVQLQSIENSLVYPQFAGFVQGWMFAAMLPADAPDYRQALEAYHFMMSQCAGFAVSQDLKFNKLIHTLYGLKSLFEPVCYNNPLAPHSIEGTFIGYGDAFLKQGDLARARLWYENAKTSPTFSSWKYQQDLEYRLAHLEELSRKFAADAGKVEVSEPAMNFQSDIGCGVCHSQ